MTDDRHLQTRTVRAALETDEQHGAVVPPIHLTSTFAFAGFGQKRKYDYSRSAIRRAMRSREHWRSSKVESARWSPRRAWPRLRSLRTCSVRAASRHPARLLRRDVSAFNALARKGAVQVQFLDFGDAAALEAALARRPAMVWIETPSNPLLRIVDIATTARAARAAGALVVADNTFLSPVWQRPLELGADVVVHSTTKYLNGHSDVVGGAVIAATPRAAGAARVVGQLHRRHRRRVRQLPDAARACARCMRACGRMARMRNAWSRSCNGHPAVARVYYPGPAPTHPGHAIAQRQQQGFGAMVSCELRGDLGNVRAFLDALSCFSLAESLGGVESLVAHPASMTHAAMDETARRVAGITDTLVRLSIGIEDAEDLVRDLDTALAASMDAS